MNKIFFTINMCLLTGCSFFGVQTVEEPNYKVISEEDNFEIREYEEIVLVDTYTDKSYDLAMDENFKRLFDYIQGKNIKKQKISMTAPVIMENKDTLNTVLLFEEKTKTGWKMSFSLPKDFTFETAPKPENKIVKLRKVPAKKVAIAEFSGRWKLDNFNKVSKELQAWLKDNDIKAISSPRGAAFNPPWAIPALRRNEVHIDVEL